jgi:hypothetical protein
MSTTRNHTTPCAGRNNRAEPPRTEFTHPITHDAAPMSPSTATRSSRSAAQRPTATNASSRRSRNAHLTEAAPTGESPSTPRAGHASEACNTANGAPQPEAHRAFSGETPAHIAAGDSSDACTPLVNSKPSGPDNSDKGSGHGNPPTRVAPQTHKISTPQLAPPPQHTRHDAPSALDLQRQTIASSARRDLWTAVRHATLTQAFNEAGVIWPTPTAPAHDRFQLNRPLQTAMSEFIRRTRMPLRTLVELIRCQTPDDYRPNKAMIPELLRQQCRDYSHVDELVHIASEGIRVKLAAPLPKQHSFPRNHPSASQRLGALRANIRKEQDLFRCLVVDADITSLWPDIFVSPFGVVDKGNGDPLTTGRTIHDLSFPADASVNSHTDPSAVPDAYFEPCASVAREISHCRRNNPSHNVKLMAGDVASAYRNACTHSESVHIFAGHIPEDNALVIDLSAAFGWIGSAGCYRVLGGAVAHIHGHTTNAAHPDGFYNYHWVDDHVNVTSDSGTNCDDINRSLRSAMTTVMGPTAVNEQKFTPWQTRLKVIGLVFDTIAGTVSMPTSKINKAQRLVFHAYHSTSLSRSEYRSLLGPLRHVATCIRPARAFLQRLRCGERHLHRTRRCPVSTPMRDDLLWWWHILHAPTLNGVPLEHFDDSPPLDFTITTDASDVELCAIVPSLESSLTYEFSSTESALIHEFHQGATNEFDIN